MFFLNVQGHNTIPTLSYHNYVDGAISLDSSYHNIIMLMETSTLGNKILTCISLQNATFIKMAMEICFHIEIQVIS